jgi:2-hydroxy fatty acid dioxygenase
MSEATFTDLKDNLIKKNELVISTSSDDTESSDDTSVDNTDNTKKTISLHTTIGQTEIQTETIDRISEMLEEISEEVGKNPDKLPNLKVFGEMPFHPSSGIYTPLNDMTMDLFKRGLGEKIVKDLKNYDKFHKNTANKHIHYWALYFNMFYTLALLSTFNTAFIKVDVIVYLCYIVYYKLYGSDYCSAFMAGALGSIFAASKFYTLMLPNHVWYSLFMCLNNWVSQFYGHAIYEKNSPALTKSLTQAFTIAPVHFAVESIEKFGGIQPVMEGIIETQLLFGRKVNDVLIWYDNWKRPKNKKD